MPDMTDPIVADDKNAQERARRQLQLAKELADDAHLGAEPLAVPLLALLIAINAKR